MSAAPKHDERTQAALVASADALWREALSYDLTNFPQSRPKVDALLRRAHEIRVAAGVAS